MRLSYSPFLLNAEGGGSGGSGSPEQDKKPPADKGEGDKTPQYVTKADLETFKTEIKASEQVHSGLLGGLRNDIQKLLKPEKKPEDKEKDPTLTQRVDAIEARDKASFESLKRRTLKSVAMEAGVPAQRAGRFANIVLADFKEKITVSKDDDVFFQESDDKSTPILEWVQAYLKSADGEFFLPPKETGSSDGQKGAGKGSSAVHPYLAMTFEQIMDDKKKNPDLFLTYLEQHEDTDWIKKQKSFRMK